MCAYVYITAVPIAKLSEHFRQYVLLLPRVLFFQKVLSVNEGSLKEAEMETFAAV